MEAGVIDEECVVQDGEVGRLGAIECQKYFADESLGRVRPIAVSR